MVRVDKNQISELAVTESGTNIYFLIQANSITQAYVLTRISLILIILLVLTLQTHASISSVISRR
ncbi:hypothetical protein RW64_06440 [Geobacter sulfurreducens]|nr:hypothetical protein RW64_06440 [Geobacter sulfurreducens]